MTLDIGKFTERLIATQVPAGDLVADVGFGISGVPAGGQISWVLIRIENGACIESGTLVLPEQAILDEGLPPLQFAIAASEKLWEEIGQAGEDSLLKSVAKRRFRVAGDASLFIRHLNTFWALIKSTSG